VVDALPASGVGAVVVTPAHQYPTGVVLSAQRRRALVAWARRTGAFVIEDDYDAEYRFGRAPVAAVQPHAPDRVIYAGTVSKSLAPGLRMGWLVPPAELAAECVQAKSEIDLSTPVIEQAVLAELLASSDLDRHLRRTRLRYEARRTALLEGLAPTTALELLGEAAGLHATFALQGRRSERDLIAAARQRGVGVRGLSEHHADRRGRRGLVLGYANLTPDTIRWGASVLVELLQ
jgi:GntR family transcriptional regulator/MocR family aminotransferase